VRLRRRADRSAAPPPPDVPALVAEHLEAGTPTGWFEPLYAAAHARDRVADVPWGTGGHPYLLDWLAAPSLPLPDRPSVCVVGAGLGDDAVAVAEALPDAEVVAFDVAPSAVAWARDRHAGRGVRFEVADLLALPEGWRGTFDLVVEVRTVQSLPGVVREAAMHAIGTLVAPGGALVAVGLLATSADAARRAGGPPWPQAPSELAAYRAAGLARVALEHPPAGEDGVVEVRSTWRRAPTLPLA
jgi:hypothetical protein